jgi:ubiquinone/menaquinone biosynthesis C-methylase UbiE
MKSRLSPRTLLSLVPPLLTALVFMSMAVHAEESAASRLPSTYLGRPIAETMHWSGADWLLRGTRESEENAGAMLEALKVRPGDTVCDLGCGVGYHAVRLAKLVGPTGKVYGVDIQPEMLSRLKERAAEAGVDNIFPVLGKADDPGLPATSCELILMVDVYHEISQPQSVLRAVRRALKPGGRVAFVEFRAEDPDVPIKTLHKMSKRQLLKEVIPNGFRLVQDHDGLPWQHLMAFTPAPLEPLRVLFAGNSYTQANDLPLLVKNLGASANKAIAIEVERQVGGGWTLEQHWRQEAAATKIGSGRWDFVVLQEQSLRPILQPESMLEFARKLHGEITKAGSRCLLFMTWAWQDRPETVAKLASTYEKVGESLGALVAPVGLAWDAALRERPGLALHSEDGSHPTLAGSYLAACVIYSALTAQDPPPKGDPEGRLAADDAAFLRRVAWRTVHSEPEYISSARDRGESIPRQSQEALPPSW